MQRPEIIEQLKDYIVNRILDGKQIGLDERTSLLEWGIINSLEMVRLLSFVQEQFGVELPIEKMTADHFTNILSISDLVLEAAGDQETATSDGSVHTTQQ